MAQGGNIYFSSNQGQNWQPLGPFPFNNYGYIGDLMVNGSNLTVALEEPSIVLNSSNAGKPWNICSQNLMYGLSILSLGHDQKGDIYMGTTNGFYMYPNGSSRH